MNGDRRTGNFGGFATRPGLAKTKSRIRKSKGKLLRWKCYVRQWRQVNSIRNAACLVVAEKRQEIVQESFLFLYNGRR